MVPDLPLFRLLCCMLPNRREQPARGRPPPLNLDLARHLSIDSGSGAGSPVSKNFYEGSTPKSPQEIFPLTYQGASSFEFTDMELLWIWNAKRYYPDNYSRRMTGNWSEEDALHREQLMQQQALIPRVVLPSEASFCESIELFKKWLLSGNPIKYVITSDGFISLCQATSANFALAATGVLPGSEFSPASKRFRDALPASKRIIVTHAYAAAGQSVIAGGTACWTENTLKLNNLTGHYKCDTETLYLSKLFWEKALKRLNLAEFSNYKIELYDFKDLQTPLPIGTIV